MTRSNPLWGNTIPAHTKRIVRLQQDGHCVRLDPRLCTGSIDVYTHVAHVEAIGVHRSHANDPALVHGLCTPCAQSQDRAESRAATTRRLHRKYEPPTPAETQHGQPHVTLKETT